MAIRIPILTSFDPKGLRQANASFAKLQSSVGSLGRNFAVAGAAIGAAGAIIAKNAQALARIERINAQTSQTIESMGNASNISAGEVEKLAGSLEALTATEAETIQEGANLLLTFRNIANQAGAGNDIFNQTTAIMVDMGRALNEGAAASAIRLGKALNDPIRGLTALRKVGVGFDEQQEQQIRTMQESGDLMGAQKVILAELQAQFGGSGAAFAKTFSGQLELMGHELGTIGEEATMSVMPALQGVVEQLRELIPVLGPQLKAAIESIDFKALGQAVVGFTTFMIQNGETIAKVIIGLFALSTAYKLMAVATGIATLATDLFKYATAKAATGMTLATAATNIFAGALRLLPFVAVTAAVVALGIEVANLGPKFQQYKSDLDKANTGMSDFQVEASAATFAGQDLVTMFSPLNKIVNDLTLGLVNLILQLKGIPRTVKTTIEVDVQLERNSRNTALNSYLGFLGGRAAEATGGVIPPTIVTPTGGGAGAVNSNAFQQTLKLGNKQAAAQGKLQGLKFSQGYIDGLLGSQGGLKQANATINRISALGPKKQAAAVAKENKKFAGTIGEVNRVAAENNAKLEREAAQVSADLIAAQEAVDQAARESLAAEAAALAERERVYNSFLDSVKNTFGSIKNSILGAFDLTQLGGSTGAITRNMDKLLTRLRSFATNVKSLATMGLSPALLQQIISAGPMAGARLAEGLVMGGAEGLSAINAGFTEFGTLSGQIAQTGTESLFGTSTQQTIYNIEVGGGVGSGATIGKAIVDAIKAYERTSGAVFQGA